MFSIKFWDNLSFIINQIKINNMIYCNPLFIFVKSYKEIYKKQIHLIRILTL